MVDKNDYLLEQKAQKSYKKLNLCNLSYSNSIDTTLKALQDVNPIEWDSKVIEGKQFVIIKE